MDEALLHDLVQSALRAGADAAEAVTAEISSLSVGVRLGELEEVEREERRDLGLRVFVGRRQAVVSSSDLSPAVQARLVERAVAMARLAPEDPYCGLAPQDRLARGTGPDLQLYDPAEVSPESLEHTAQAAEAAARAVDGVSNSEGGSASWSTAASRIVTSDGFSGYNRASGFSLYAAAIAEDDNGMERGGDGRSVRHLADLPGAEEIGTEAGRRAVQRLGARKIDSCTAAVVFENRGATQVLSPFVGAISGAAVARGVSFLKDKLGARIFAKGVDIVDEPLRVRGLGSAAFDDEGVATARRALVEDGVLTTWLLNSGTARQLGMQTTGHASRGLADAPGVSTHNLTLQPGEASLEDLMRQAGKGLLVTSMFGPSLNNNTGDWSAGVSGFWFENGELAYPVTEITVAGNLIELYARMIPGSDLEIRGSSNAPSLLIDGLAVAGKVSGDLDLLREVAHEAGRLATRLQESELHIQRKAGGSPVTNADIAADTLIKTRLRAARPDYGWLSEETADDRSRFNGGRLFMVDPIDGTVAFIKGRPWWTVSVAVVEDGRALAGVIYAPRLEETYEAERGGGARLNGAPIHASACAELEACAMLSPIGAFTDWKGDPAWPQMRIENRNSIALRMGLVAAGAFDAAVALSPKADWDLAAGLVIAEEAGAVATDHMGSPLRLNGPSALHPSLVCAGPALHRLILQRTATIDLPPTLAQ